MTRRPRAARSGPAAAPAARDAARKTARNASRNAARRAALGAAVCAVLGLASGPAAAKEFKVGVLLPFSGVYATLGEQIENGFKLGVAHFGDRLGPHSLTLLREDSEAKPAVGLAKAKKLVLQERVDIVAGVVSSAVLAGLRDFADATETPIVVANAGNDDMTGERCSPYLVRVSFSNSQTVRPMGRWMYEKGVRTAYLMAPDYAAGRQQMNTFRAEFEAAGGEIVGEAYPPLQGVQDYGPYLTTAQAQNPDALFAFFAGGAAIRFVKQHDAFGLKETLPLYGAGWLVSPAYVAVQGSAADGVIGSLNYVTSIDTPENARFQQGYRDAHGEVGSEYAVAGYDAARLIIEAIAAAEAEGAADDKARVSALLSQVSFKGPRGPLKIDPATNNVVQNIYIFETTVSEDGVVAQTVLDVAEDVADPPNGCAL